MIEIYDDVPNMWNKSIKVISVVENFSDFQVWQGGV